MCRSVLSHSHVVCKRGKALMCVRLECGAMQVDGYAPRRVYAAEPRRRRAKASGEVASCQGERSSQPLHSGLGPEAPGQLNDNGYAGCVVHAQDQSPRASKAQSAVDPFFAVFMSRSAT